jgi:hypothetical protein
MNKIAQIHLIEALLMFIDETEQIKGEACLIRESRASWRVKFVGDGWWWDSFISDITLATPGCGERLGHDWAQMMKLDMAFNRVNPL